MGPVRDGSFVQRQHIKSNDRFLTGIAIITSWHPCWVYTKKLIQQYIIYHLFSFQMLAELFMNYKNAGKTSASFQILADKFMNYKNVGENFCCFSNVGRLVYELQKCQENFCFCPNAGRLVHELQTCQEKFCFCNINILT